MAEDTNRRADFLHRLNLVEGNRLPGPKAEQVAEAGRPPCSILRHEICVGVGDRRGDSPFRPRSGRLLQGDYDRRGPAMVLTVLPESHPAMIRQRPRRLGRLEGCRMPSHHVLGNLLEADSTDGRGRYVEAPGDYLVAQAQDLEDLRATIGGECGDPHLRQNLEQPFLRRRSVLHPSFSRILPGCPACSPLPRGPANGFQRQPGMHRLRPVAEESREMMNIERVS